MWQNVTSAEQTREPGPKPKGPHSASRSLPEGGEERPE